jgi:hypothetical protein
MRPTPLRDALVGEVVVGLDWLINIRRREEKAVVPDQNKAYFPPRQRVSQVANSTNKTAQLTRSTTSRRRARPRLAPAAGDETTLARVLAASNLL